MEVSVSHMGAVEFKIETRGHTIISDQPEPEGGFDEGMTPPELLLASLGSCAGYYAAQYLRKHRLAEEGVRVRVTAGKAKYPARLDDFRIEVQAPLSLSAAQQEGMLQSVRHCLIHNTLLGSPRIDIAIIEPPADDNAGAGPRAVAA